MALVHFCHLTEAGLQHQHGEAEHEAEDDDEDDKGGAATGEDHVGKPPEDVEMHVVDNLSRDKVPSSVPMMMGASWPVAIIKHITVNITGVIVRIIFDRVTRLPVVPDSEGKLVIQVRDQLAVDSVAR